MTLSDNKAAQQRIWRMLSEIYGAQVQKHGYWPGLVGHLGRYEVDEVLAAIDAHINDETEVKGEPRGHWAPRVADVRRQLDTIKRRQASAARGAAAMEQEQGHRIQLRVQYMEVDHDTGRPRAGRTHTVDTWESRCHHCSDRGIARFVYDPHDSKRVWMAPEALNLPPEMLWRLKYGSAICDCPRGDTHPRRYWTVEKWNPSVGAIAEMHVYPRLKHLRQLANRRRTQERDLVGGIEEDTL